MVSVTGEGESGEVRQRLAAVFRSLATVYAWEGTADAMVLPTSLRQAVAIAEATRRAVGADPGRCLHAGVALLSTEDDPATAVSLAARCLAIAAESPVGKVVSQTDPEARAARRFGAPV